MRVVVEIDGVVAADVGAADNAAAARVEQDGADVDAGLSVAVAAMKEASGDAGEDVEAGDIETSDLDAGVAVISDVDHETTGGRHDA